MDEARKDADETRRSTHAMQQHVKALEHWTLTDKQKTALVESLRKTPSLKTWVSNNRGDTLAEEYAQQFAQVLRDCGWDVDYGQGDSDTVPSGVVLTIGKGTQEPPAAMALRTALAAAGIHITFSMNNSEPSDYVELRIGHKPIK